MATITIAHLSDLHFGMARQDEIWLSLRYFLNEQICPHLILVTGDIVDTSTGESLYRDARNGLDELRCHYRVCPGNHDRYPMGNAFGRQPARWFDDAFSGMIATPDTLCCFNLSDRWKVSILGIDSSASAKYSAQGFASPADLAALSRADSTTQDADPDLVILLTHHPLLPIAELERSKPSIGALFSPTIMLNPGTMLKALTKSNINLVLHGHDHQRTVARYGTVYGRGSEIVVVGAGSATGADTRQGCNFRRASFNLLELCSNGSVYMREVRHDGQKWDITLDPECHLLDSRAVRQSRFYRRSRLTSIPTSHMTTTTVIHANRDITFKHTWTNWIVEQENWPWGMIPRIPLIVPLGAQVKCKWVGGETTVRNLQFSRGSMTDEVYERQATTYPSARGPRLADEITLICKWRGAAALTDADSESMVPATISNSEFAATTPQHELASLSLVLQLPLCFAPDLADVWVGCEGPFGEEAKERPELNEAIKQVAPGIFSLEVPYPLKGFSYRLMWRLAKENVLDPTVLDFRTKLSSEPDARALLKVFLDALGPGAPTGRCSAALYAPTAADRQILKREMLDLTGNFHSSDLPPEVLSLRDSGSLHRWGWWGEIQAAIVDDPERDDEKIGSVKGERALVIIPIKSFRHEGEVPWCIIRLGLYGDGTDISRYLKHAMDNGSFHFAALSVIGAAHARR